MKFLVTHPGMARGFSHCVPRTKRGATLQLLTTRRFLDRIATHILAFEGDSHVEWFEGNFQDYEKDKMRRLGADSVMPQRIKYKKFSR